jgi:hypothetical protein
MKKRIVILLFLDALFGGFLLFGQSLVYMQKIANDVNNGYPTPLLPGAEWRTYAQPVYESNTVTTWSSDGSNTVFANNGTNHLQVGDGVQIHNFPGVYDQICQVSAVPDSSHFYISGYSCTNTGAPYLSAGSGSAAGMYYWKREGTGMSPLGTWEVISHGTTAAKTFMRNADRTVIAAGTPCTPDLHQSTCYVSHPVLTNAAPWAVYFEIDPSVVPVCTMSGTLQAHNLVLTSTVMLTVKFTSNQTGDSNSQEYIVCEDGAGSGLHALPKIQGGYEQSYKNEQHPVYAQVFANADQYVIWSITSDSGTGDATIETFNPPAGDGFVHNGGKLPQAVFHSGTHTDGYYITACSDFNPSSCTKTRRYVSAQTKPAGNVDKVQQAPCDIDPVMTGAGGTVYEIGPGQTYADMKTPPAWNFAWGSIFRVHNETASPGSPLIFANYVEFVLPNNYTSHASDYDVPSFYLCGVPQPTTGELPIVDGINATASTHIGGFTGQGNNLTFTGIPVTLPINDVYRPDLQPWHHLGVTGLHIRNNGPGYYYYPPGQTTGTQTPWSNLGSGVRPFALQNYSFFGLFIENTPNGVTSDCNAQAGWVRGCALDVMYRGNHFAGYGSLGQATEHAVYCQDIRCVMSGNLEDGSKSDQATGGFSMRGTRALYVNNRVYGKDGVYYVPNGWGGDSEVQDAAYYFDLNRAFGPTPGWDGTSCSDGTSNYPFCNPNGVSGMAFGGLATAAAFQVEHWDSLYMIGNAMHSVPGANGGCRMGIPQTHGNNGLEMQHNLYYFYNLNDCPNAEGNDGDSFFEDVRPHSGQNDFSIQPIDWPMARWGNSINWWNDNYNLPGGGYRTSFGRPTARGIFQTNVFHEGQFTPTQTNIAIQYGNYSFNASNYGLTPGTAQDQFTGFYPVEARQGGWSSANFITSPTKPYNTTTLVPLAGSAAAGTASPLPYPALLYAPMFNATDANNNLARRTSLADIGPADAVGGPTAVSIAITPSSFTIALPGTQTLTCTTTLSDSSTRSCFGPVCTSTNTAAATVSTLTVTGVAAGTGNINCGAESLTASPVPFTVTGAGPTVVSIAMTPNPISLTTGGTQVLACTTTLSNATTRSCISPACTSNNTASATVSGLTVTATTTPGTGTINCSAESHTAPGDNFTVTGTPTVGTQILGTFTIMGAGQIR